MKSRRTRRTAGGLRCSPRIAPLVAGRGQIVAFRDLPKLAQFALIQYMSFDGEAWPAPDDVRLSNFAATRRGEAKRWRCGRERGLLSTQELFMYIVDDYITQYGDEQFGYAEIPMTDLIASVMQDADIQGRHGSFEDYTASYHDQGNVPKHKTTERRLAPPTQLLPFRREGRAGGVVSRVSPRYDGSKALCSNGCGREYDPSDPDSGVSGQYRFCGECHRQSVRRQEEERRAPKWHLTNKPNFQIDAAYRPVWAYGTTRQNAKPALFLTDQPVYWSSWFASGPIYAILVQPSSSVRNFGLLTLHPEWLDEDPARAVVLERLTLREAIAKYPNVFGSERDWEGLL